MTTNINGGTEFMGLSIRKVRDILRAWRLGNGDPVAIGSRSEVGEDPRLVVALLAELEENGLIGEEHDRMLGVPFRGLTDKGRGLTTAAATRRAPRRSAQKVLDALLDRAARINEDPDVTLRAERVWVFGSMIDPGREDVGDIDFVVESERKEPYRAMGFDDRLRHILKIFSSELPKGIDPIMDDAEWHVFRKRLYGGRRHPLLAPNDIDTLKKLHRPCRLVFDASRGGRVDDPVLPHHPGSMERASTIQPKLSVPDLSLTDGMMPCDARFLIDGYEPFDVISDMRDALDYVPPPWAPGSVGTFSIGRIIATPVEARDRLSDVLSEDTLPAGLEAVDGKNRFAVSFSRYPYYGKCTVPAWVIVDREVFRDEDRWVHRTTVHLRGPECERLRDAELEWVKMAVLMLGGADAARLDVRRVELGSDAEIEMQFGVGGDGEASERLRKRLEAVTGSGFFSHMPEPFDEDDFSLTLSVLDEPVEFAHAPPRSDGFEYGPPPVAP